MKRNTMLKILNPIMGLLLLNQLLTGLFAESLSHEAFETMHETGGFALAAAAVLHLVLNWNWVKASFFKSGQAVQS